MEDTTGKTTYALAAMATMAVAALLVAMVAFGSFAHTARALTQKDIDLVCSILNCGDELRATLEALIDDETPKITQSLWIGAIGDEVELLQEILASDPTIYPEGLVTGYFGPLTNAAVLRFQARFGIEQVGNVGPITRGAINGILEQEAGKSGKIPPGLLKKFGPLAEEGDTDDTGTTTDDGTGTTTENGDEDTDSVVQGAGVGKVVVCHVPRGNPAAKHTISVGAPALGTHLAHGDAAGACGTGATENGGEGGNGEDGDANGEEDTTAPVISGVSADSATSTTADITWTTDESADSEVWYATTTPVDTEADDTEMEMASSLVTDHLVPLTGLEPDTTYFFLVGSTDEAGNSATASEDSFTTASE